MCFVFVGLGDICNIGRKSGSLVRHSGIVARLLEFRAGTLGNHMLVEALDHDQAVMRQITKSVRSYINSLPVMVHNYFLLNRVFGPSVQPTNLYRQLLCTDNLFCLPRHGSSMCSLQWYHV